MSNKDKLFRISHIFFKTKEFYFQLSVYDKDKRHWVWSWVLGIISWVWHFRLVWLWSVMGIIKASMKYFIEMCQVPYRVPGIRCKFIIYHQRVSTGSWINLFRSTIIIVSLLYHNSIVTSFNSSLLGS